MLHARVIMRFDRLGNRIISQRHDTKIVWFGGPRGGEGNGGGEVGYYAYNNLYLMHINRGCLPTVLHSITNTHIYKRTHKHVDANTTFIQATYTQIHAHNARIEPTVLLFPFTYLETHFRSGLGVHHI